MASAVSKADLPILLREADAAARRLVRRLGLPFHQIEDVRQELLADLIGRMPAYDADRGTLGAFAGVVLTHKAARVAAGVRRERALFGNLPISLDEPLPDAEGLTRGDLVREEDGYGALIGQPTDRFGETERRLGIENGLAVLSDSDGRLCASLGDATVDDLATSGRGARTSLYRQIGRIRLDLTAVGIAGA